MFIEERHQYILELLNEEGRLSAAEIQDRFGVSFDTARRDLRILEEKGLLKRTHGGALPLRQVGFAPIPPGMTPKDMKEIKPNYLAIALKAIEQIAEQDVIYLTTASVGYLMAQNLPADKRITVATNSIIVAEVLRQRENIRTILIGGEMDPKGFCYDSFAAEQIRRMRFDRSFITSAGISAQFGLSIQRTNSVGFWNAVIDSSRMTYGLYPTEKIGFDSIVSICPTKRLNALITDWDASEDDLKGFDELGVEVFIAEKEE